MSTHVVMTFQAKPGSVESVQQFLTDFQDRAVEAGAFTASLLQDERDPAHILELEIWQSADHHRRFVEAAAATESIETLSELLLFPLKVDYLDTVKYSRNRHL